MALRFGGIEFEDVGVKEFYGKGWGEGAKDETPFGSLPVLAVGDEQHQIAQTGSIMRYVCGSLVPKLTPADPIEAARCDMLFEAAQELQAFPHNVNPIVNIFRGEAFAEKKAEYFEKAPFKISKLATYLDASPGPFFLGATPYYCDLALFHVLDNTRTLEPSALDSHPKLLTFMDAVAALPGVAGYLAERPDAVDIGTAPMLRSKGVDETPSKKPKV